MKLKTLLSGIILLIAPYLLFAESVSFNRDNPYFSYSKQELQDLRSTPFSDHLLSIETFTKWDAEIYRLTEKEMTIEGASFRFMAYFYTAQRDFALLSLQTSQKWIGDPKLLHAKIIQLFYPKYSLQQYENVDLYSKKICDLVFDKIEKRFRLEESQLTEYPALSGPDYWNEKPPFIGRRLGKCKPWLLTSLEEFQAPAPPGPQSIIWVYGIEQIKEAQSHLTNEQRRLIHYWAGEFGPESGNWFAISNEILQKKGLSISNFLLARTIFALGYTDALISVFDSKYTYWVRRPFMLDPQLIQIIPTPKHPTYPSAHSTASSAAALMLSSFFPKEKEKWQNLAIQAGNTRIWAGLHFIYDHEQGLIQGEKIGNGIIKQFGPFSLE